MYAGVLLAIARMESGEPGAGRRAVRRLRREARRCRCVPGGWRAKYLELLTRCWLLLGRRAEAERAAAAAHAVAAATGLGTAAAWADRAAACGRARLGRPRHGRRARRSRRPPLPTRRVRAVEAAVSRTLAGRALALAGERDRAVAELELAVAVLDAAGAIAFGSRPSASCESSATASHRRTRPGKTDGTGVDSLTRARARARTPRRRSQDEPRDRRHAVPQPEDRRDAPAEHVPQAERHVTRRAGTRGRASRPRRGESGLAGVRRNLLRPHEVAGRARLAVLVADDQQASG